MSNIYPSYIITLICVICAFYVFNNMKIKKDRVKFLVNTMGQNTLGIYLLHVPLGYIMLRIFTQFTKGRVSGGVVSVVFCVILTITSLMLTLIIRKIPILKKY